jgi:hypothetical protein
VNQIIGHQLTQESHPCGRLVKASYDSQTKIMEFTIPSDETAGLVYGVELDCSTGEIVCPCKDFGYRKSSKAGYLKHGVYLEHAERAANQNSLWPLVTRKPSGLCKHANRVRYWLKRHNLYRHIETIVKAHEDAITTNQ